MRYKLQQTTEVNDSLIIFFMGWSCEPMPLDKFHIEGWDILYLYDYQEAEIPLEALAIIGDYERYSLMAHSFGVAVANEYIAQLPQLKTSIAICGTLLPVSEKYGIPSRPFNVTLNAIGREGITLFNKKMCGENITNYKPSTLPLSSQVTALKSIAERYPEREVTKEERNQWNVAIICMKDEIIPVDNQIAFWGESNVEVLGFKTQPHYPFTINFAKFITTIL